MLCFIATRGGSETAGLGYLRARLPGLGVAQGSQGGGLSPSPSVCSWGCLSRSVFSASLTASAGIPYEGPSWDMLPATTLLSWPGTKRCHPQTAPLLVHKPEASCAVSPFHRFFWLRGNTALQTLLVQVLARSKPLGGCKVTLGARCVQPRAQVASQREALGAAEEHQPLGSQALEQFQLARSKILLIVCTPRQSRC